MAARGERQAEREVRRETLARGRRFDFERVWVEAESGKEVARDVVRYPGAVVVVGVLGDGRVVLIRNYRVAVGAWLWEAPAGTLDKGEAPEACAKREMEEETGYRPGRVEKLGEFYTTPGLTDELMRAFAAFDLEEREQKLDDGEFVEVRPVGAGEALGMISRGEIRDGKTIVALLMAERAGLLGRGGGS